MITDDCPQYAVDHMSMAVTSNSFYHAMCLSCVDSGRGLMALKYFKPGDVIISLPENLLITPSSVLSSFLGPVLCRFVKM